MIDKGLMPDLPFIKFCHSFSRPIPIGVMTPMPVTTTRLGCGEFVLGTVLVSFPSRLVFGDDNLFFLLSWARNLRSLKPVNHRLGQSDGLARFCVEKYARLGCVRIALTGDEDFCFDSKCCSGVAAHP